MRGRLHPGPGSALSDALVFRFARAAETGDVARLVSHSFPGASRTPEWIRAQLEAPRFGGGAETLFVGEEGGRVVAALQLHPLRQWVGGELLPCAGVGTVAVSPAHRRRKVGGALVTAALQAAVERGDVVSALYPFRVAFYQQLGYGQASEALQYQVAPAMLPDAPERLGVELLEDAGAHAEALALYREWAATQNGQMDRNPAMWAEQLLKHDRVLVGYRDDAGTLRGYALGVYRAELPPRERFLEVDELVWTTAAARRGLYAWVASLADQWQQVLIRGLPSQRLGDWIREPRLPTGSAPPWQLWAPAATLLAGTMFRVLDMERAWRSRRLAGDEALDLVIQVDDGQLPGNSGAWRIVAEEGRCVALPAGDAPHALRMDMSTLSRLFMGSLPASAAVAAGLAECPRPAVLPLLDRALALPEPWTFERF
jgi:predicted acetyltransferase